MADPNDMEEVQVSAGEVAPFMSNDRRGAASVRSGLSPLQSALLYGGAASTVMGPAGILIGLGAGILSKRMRDSELDRAARETRLLSSEDAGFNSQMQDEMKVADPDEQRMLNYAKRLKDAGLKRLMNGDQKGRAMWDQANQVMQGIIQGDVAGRKADEAANNEALRGLTTDAAKAYRTEYQTNIGQFEEINKQADRVLDLVNSKDFDPNKPFNKAILSDLLSVGVNGLYNDDPGGLTRMAEAVPVIGDLMAGGVEWWKSEEYKLKKEDFNRIALEIKSTNAKTAKSRMDRLGQQTQSLDGFARKNGISAQDYSLVDYVTGNEKDLRLTPTPSNALTTAPTTRSKSDVLGPTGLFSDSPAGKRILEWTNKATAPQQKAARPTN